MDNPKGIKMNQKMAHGKAVALYPWRFGLHIYHNYNDGQ